MTARRSIRRRLALAAIALVLAVVTLIAGVAYREVRAAAVEAASAHLRDVSRQLADMLGGSGPSVLTGVSGAAKDSAIVAFAREPRSHPDSAVLAALRRASLTSVSGGSTELWDSTGAVLAATQELPKIPPDLTRGLIARATGPRDARAGGATAIVSPIDSVDGALAYQVIAPLPAQKGRSPIGYVVLRRLVTTPPQTINQIKRLIGPQSRFLVGNSAGDLWTDLNNAVSGPPPSKDGSLNQVSEYAQSDGERVLYAVSPIASTPWSVAVESPRSLALAPVRYMLWRLAWVTLLLFALASAGAWWLSGTLTRPIARLAEGARAISAGNYGKRLPVEWRDELGTFTTAFNEMADGVATTLGALEGKVDELKDLESRYRLLFESSPQPMWVYDLETRRFLAVNDAAIRRYGYSRDAFLVMSIQDIRPPEDISALDADLARLEIEGRAHSEIWRHRIASGEIIEVEMSSRSLVFAGRPARMVLVTDLTERRRAETSAREAHERLERVIGSSAAVLFELRVDAHRSVFEWISGNITQILGYSVDDVHRDDWWTSNVHPIDLARLPGPPGSDPIRSSINEYRFRHRDGQYRWIREEQRRVSDPGTGTEKVIGAWFDMTAQRSLEFQLQQAQKMEAVGRLAGGVAHDFNNLLTVMLAECQLVESDPEMPADERAESLGEIRAAAERAARLTRQLLTFSRRQLVEPLPVDVNNVVAEVDKMLQRLIGEDIELRLRLADPSPIAIADRGQIEQVIVNLAVNARDAMPEGGSLTIETDLVTLDEAYCDVRVGLTPGRYVQLAVSDTGTGMTEEVQAHIFEPFFTTKGADKGTGLGLATCYVIARQFGGHIAAYSEVGIGTTFKLYLPCSTTPSRTASAEGANQLVGGEELILLVEDDPSVRRSTARMLTSAGYAVLQAANADEAQALLRDSIDHRIDLLLTDVVLPGTGGREFAEDVLRDHPDIRVLFMSGYSDDIVLQHRLAERNLRLLQKPFTVNGLLAKVRETLAATV